MSAAPSLRIIAGDWRGRKLQAPAGATTRPTSDRARETLFSMLTSRLGGFTDLRVADLFAGSGALGFEALSRGAASCLFVDQDRSAIAAIRANAAALGTTSVDIRQTSAATPVPVTQPFDLILCDAPYAFGGQQAMMAQLISVGWAKSGTMLSVENGDANPIDVAGWQHLVSRKVGKAHLHLFTAT